MGDQAPVDSASAPMSRFQPPFTLTSAQRFIRTQLRAVQGAHTRSAASVAAAVIAAARRQARRPAPAAARSPKAGARTSDCGRTRVARPITRPTAAAAADALREVAVARAQAATAAAHVTSAAVTPSVISAGV